VTPESRVVLCRRQGPALGVLTRRVIRRICWELTRMPSARD
jgi:hypothetical protein